VVSLVASCQFHDIEPWAYLRDVLTLLPSWPANQVLALSVVREARADFIPSFIPAHLPSGTPPK